jgi:predicted nuclease of restriction endonuclease-like (RecB) superfamily
MNNRSIDLVFTDSIRPPFSTKEYAQTLAELKPRIRQAQLKAAMAANAEMTRMYWEMGKLIVERQDGSCWGTKFIELLVKDLRSDFPGNQGFSRTNLFRMRAFYLANKLAVSGDGQAQELPIYFNLPWTYNILLLERVKDPKQCLWYAQQTLQNGWGRQKIMTKVAQSKKLAKHHAERKNNDYP